MRRADRVGAAGALVLGLLLPFATAASAPLTGNGKLAFAGQRPNFDTDVWSAQPDGSARVDLTDTPGIDAAPSWSPDGTRLAFGSARDSGMDLYVMNADGSNVVRLTNRPRSDDDPAWSPDGTKVAFTRWDVSSADIAVIDLATLAVTVLTGAATTDVHPAWSPDGSKIAYQSNVTGQQADIWVMDADGTDPVDITNTPNSFETAPAWSPDGAHLAVGRTEIGNVVSGVIIMDADGSDPVRVVDGMQPAWSPDGNQLAFVRDDDIFVMHADGSDPHNVTNDALRQSEPSWQPVAPIVPTTTSTTTSVSLAPTTTVPPRALPAAVTAQPAFTG